MPRDAFESILGDLFRKAHWRIQRQSSSADPRPDFAVDAGARKYIVKVKIASEARGDRLIPLLSQAILEVQAIAHEFPKRAIPVAVVASKRIPASLVKRLHLFAERYAPNVGVGIIDSEGLRSFAGPGLDVLDAKLPRRKSRPLASSQHQPDLFSDLNQWMLKILLAERLPDPMIAGPREQVRNASHLARIAGVSVMSASRLVNQLASQGFLDRDEDHLHIVRADELLERWVSANRQPVHDVAARWIIKQDHKQFLANVANYVNDSTLKGHRKLANPVPRCCIGLFAAADALGMGFVRGVVPYLYLEWLDPDVLRKLGLSLEDADRRADVVIRIPSNKEAILRAAVLRDGVPVSDVLQVWLDTSVHPTRGREQADEIRRRVLKPLFVKRR
jgi:hypothetical protein